MLLLRGRKKNPGEPGWEMNCMMQKRISSILLLMLILVGFAGLLLSVQPTQAAYIQQPTPGDDEVNAIAHQLFCPVCENTPLDVCDTEACRQWRDLIRQMLAEGRTETEIKQYFADTYGIRVLSEPPVRGFNWLVYIVPPVAFLAGAFLLFRAFRIWKKLPSEQAIDQAATVATPTVKDTYVERFEEELKRRK
jgi:cytochrome c-type biogenesis protein CcmH